MSDTVGPTRWGLIVSVKPCPCCLQSFCATALKRIDVQGQPAKESGHLHSTIQKEMFHGLFGVQVDIRIRFWLRLRLFLLITPKLLSQITFGNKGSSCIIHLSLIEVSFLSFGLISTLKLLSFGEVISWIIHWCGLAFLFYILFGMLGDLFEIYHSFSNSFQRINLWIIQNEMRSKLAYRLLYLVWK